MIFVNNCLYCGRETKFYQSINNLIISYPLIWHNIMENIVKQDYIVSTDNYHLVVLKDKINRRISRCYDLLFKIFEDNQMILNVEDNRNFYIVTISNPNISRIFYDYDFWLFLITVKALKDYGISFEENEYFSLQKMSKYLTLIINENEFLVLFNDTSYNYKIDSFFETFKKRIILISTKQLTIENIKIIKYNFQYYKFKEELLQTLLFSF